MVAGCPKCNARYRVDAEKIGPDGSKLRCTKCSAVFLVRAPRPSAEPTPRAPTAAAAVPMPEAPPAAAPAVAENVDRRQLVLVADPDEARGKATAEAIRGWGLTPLLVADGVEAMLAIQRTLPAAVILDAALPKMFGFQVCEVVKRNDSLRDTTVVLIGAIHDQDRYRRNPSDLYGADVYVESPDVPEALYAVLREAGMPITGGSSSAPASEAPPAPEPILESPPPRPAAQPTPEPVAAPPPTPAPSSAPAPAAAADEDPERAAERERAQRLARIAVSEMVLYQPEKFDRASRDGTLEQALDLEIQEARALLRQRIGEEVRAETDFIMDELSRVAAERGGQA